MNIKSLLIWSDTNNGTSARPIVNYSLLPHSRVMNYQLFKTSREAWSAMIEATRGANELIECEQFILVPDEAGKPFLDALVEKQQSGVQVRLLCDWIGSNALYFSDYPDKLRELGAEVRFFNQIKPFRIGTFSSLFFRTHRKILITDNQTLLTGGVGFRKDFSEWRDTHIQVSDRKAVAEAREAFDKLWDLAEKPLSDRLDALRHAETGHTIIENAPYFEKRFLYQILIDKIRDASTSIKLTTAYFIPDHRLKRALILAAHRGVTIEIIVPKRSDVTLADIAKRSHYTTLLKAGVRIYEYLPRMNHAKTAVIDSNWSFVGSMNLDHLSFSYNYEVGIVSEDDALITELESDFKSDKELSREVLLERHRIRSLYKKLQELCVLPIRRLL